MANLVLTPSGGSAITFVAPIADFAAIANRYWHDYDVMTSEYRLQRVFAPATDGAARVRDGFERRQIVVQVWYVAASLSNLNSAIEADDSALKNKVSSVAIPDGSTYGNCTLERGSPEGGTRVNETGVYRKKMVYEFVQEENA